MRPLLLLAAVASLACGASRSLRPFTSDGCSLFPDGKVGDKRLWCDCCFEHDLAYWRGGTREDREQADRTLRSCVFQKTRDPKLAAIMYDGVRLGGAPYFPNWYRWAYGWPFGRTYEPLTEMDVALANELREAYLASHPGGYCARK
jgi:hypothetical protein